MEIIFERFVARLASEIVFFIPIRFGSTIEIILLIEAFPLLILNPFRMHIQFVSIHPLVTCCSGLLTVFVSFVNLTDFLVCQYD